MLREPLVVAVTDKKQHLRPMKEDIAVVSSERSSISGHPDPASGVRVALLTPYDGGNLGDAAIQDAMIENLRLRIPSVRFSGVSLNCNSFREQHGGGAFPLCATSRPFYAMSRSSSADTEAQPDRKWARWSRLRRFLSAFRSWGTAPWREFRHSLRGYWFLRGHDLLIVSGGGQLDEEWGGPWGHPFALFKWAVLARIARVPYAIASVGACKVTSPFSRRFLSGALRMAKVRSYRDKNTKALACALFPGAEKDPIVPDLAFSLPLAGLPDTAAMRSSSQDTPVIAMSLIAYSKPGFWPHAEPALYNRYLDQMALIAATLMQRGCALVLACSSRGDDESVIPDLLARLDPDSRSRVSRQVRTPTIATWKSFVAALGGVHALVASRLHSAILGLMTQTPTVAISFDSKVDWLMQDIGLPECRLSIRDFTAGDVIQALDRIELRRKTTLDHIASRRRQFAVSCSEQYEALATLAIRRARCERTSRPGPAR